MHTNLSRIILPANVPLPKYRNSRHMIPKLPEPVEIPTKRQVVSEGHAKIKLVPSDASWWSSVDSYRHLTARALLRLLRTCLHHGIRIEIEVPHKTIELCQGIWPIVLWSSWIDTYLDKHLTLWNRVVYKKRYKYLMRVLGDIGPLVQIILDGYLHGSSHWRDMITHVLNTERDKSWVLNPNPMCVFSPNQPIPEVTRTAVEDMAKLTRAPEWVVIWNMQDWGCINLSYSQLTDFEKWRREQYAERVLGVYKK